MAIPEFERIIAAARRMRNGTATAEDGILLNNIDLRPLSGGNNNAVYGFSLSGQCYVLKCYKVDERRRADKEWAGLTFAALHSCNVTPRLLYASQDGREPAAVLAFVEGQHLGDVALDHRQAAALARTLTDLHMLARDDGAQKGLMRLAQARDRISRLPVATGTPYMLAYVRRLGHICLGVRHKAAELYSAWLSGPDPVLLGHPAPIVFSSGDPNLANCLWDGNQVRIVDFEYSGWSDRAFHLADIIEHPRSWATSDAVWSFFVDCFVIDEAEHARLEAARRMMGIFWLLKFWQLFGVEDKRFIAQMERVGDRGQATGYRG